MAVILILSVLQVSYGSGSADREREEVKKVIEELYIKGWFLRGDAGIIRQAFHEDCDYMAFQFIDVKKTPVTQMLDTFTVHPPPGPGEFDYRYLSITTTPRSASAVLEITLHRKQSCTIHLALLKLKEGWKIVNKVLYDNTYPVPGERRVDQSVDPAIYDTYVGAYRSLHGESFKVEKEGRRLYVSTPGNDKLEWFPQSETVFFSRAVGGLLTFLKNKKGTVTGLMVENKNEKIIAAKLKSFVTDSSDTDKLLAIKEVVAGPFPTKSAALEKYEGELPDGLELPGFGARSLVKGYFIVKSSPIITTRDLAAAFRDRDQYGSPVIGITLKDNGADRMKTYTTGNIGKKVAIILDDQVLSAPVIQDVISKHGRIVGNFTAEEADMIILQLRLSMSSN